MPLNGGTRLGPYEIVNPLGSGGMGEVYRARDTRLGRDVAIKILPEHVATDRHLRERFDREARAVAALSHPNILAIYDVGTHDDIPYAAIELLDGVTLRDRIAGAPLPLRTAVDYAVQIGRGLAAAHDRGIVHRDLKPDNIFITRDGHLKILDFGLATAPMLEPGASVATRLPETERGMMLGTVGYMSPEQARAETADARSDLFSFGCVLYEMVSGRRAFKGDSRIETLHAILKDNPADLIASGRDVPPALDRLIMRCVEKVPADRFQTARDLVFALENLLDASSTSVHHPAPAPPVARRWSMAAVAAALAVAIAGGTWWAVARRSRPAAAAAAAKPADDPRRLIAVLPFENITRDSKPGYFGAGMTDEVTSQLSKIGALRVVSRAAVAKFKDVKTDLAAMVGELGVGSVVTGTVREDGGRVRVGVELVDARSGELIWAEQYDRDATDVFAVQSDIALRVSEALKASVTLEEQARLGKRPTSSVAAYQLFVRGRAMRRSVRPQLLESLDLLRQAVALDPQFALAFSELAVRYQFLASFGDLSAGPRGLDAAHKAIAVDPQLAQGHHALAVSLGQVGRLRESIEAFRKAVALDPSFTDALNDIGVALNIAGRFDEALVGSIRAMQLTPNQSVSYYHVGFQLLPLDDDARTERFLAAAAARFPTASRLQMLLAQLDLRRGRPEAALERIKRAVDARPDDVEMLMARSELATLAGSPDAPRFTQPLLADSANAPTQLIWHQLKLLHAYQLHTGGQTARAAVLLDEVLAANEEAIISGADWPMPAHQNASIFAMRGDSKTALDWLERAHAAGWKDARTTRLNPMLASLRQEPRFTQLMARMEADVAAMRARADYSGLP